MSPAPTESERRARAPKQSGLTIVWVNVGKGPQTHAILMDECARRGADIVNVQEPWTGHDSKTIRHGEYDLFAPVTSWGGDTTRQDNRARAQLQTNRPRALTYVRKDVQLRATQTALSGCRDIVWIDVNGVEVCNIYRAPGCEDALKELLDCQPRAKSVVGGDFNLVASVCEPGEADARGGDRLTAWAEHHDMLFIGTPGMPTHNAGHVLDLSFSNIPFAYTEVDEDLRTGSDHETLVTRLPERGSFTEPPAHYRVSDARLPQLRRLLRVGMVSMPSSSAVMDATSAEEWAESFEKLWTSAITAVGSPAQQQGRGNPWWNDECARRLRGYRYAKKARSRGIEPTRERKLLQNAVRAARRAFWRRIIDNAVADRNIFSVVGWHKLKPALRPPPIRSGDQVVTDPMEKAKVLKNAVLGRFSATDDLQEDPLQGWAQAECTVPWPTAITAEETRRCTIGVKSTSPGVDHVTVRLLTAAWDMIAEPLRAFYEACLRLSFFPSCWKRAEVTMCPKLGDRDLSDVRSWRPIALLMVLAKGLERLIARRLAWALLENGLLSPTHGGALPKRAATDLIAALTHDIELGLAEGKVATIITRDVKGAFDALLHRRLIQKMRRMGFDIKLLRIVLSFLTGRSARIRFDGATTPFSNIECGTPQGSPLSPILYLIYLAELVLRGGRWRFAYADDVLFVRISETVEQNVMQLELDLATADRWAVENKVQFAPEKTEVIHISRGRAPCPQTPVLVSGIEVHPKTEPTKHSKLPGLRWLGYWFDGKLSGACHVNERVAAASRVANHVRGLARVKYGPPAQSLRKAVDAIVVPMLTYAAESWYKGPHMGQGCLEKRVEVPLTIAAKAVVPSWRTTPHHAVLRDAGLPSARVALEATRLRFAYRLKAADETHPLVSRQQAQVYMRGPRAGQPRTPVTRLQRAAQESTSFPRPHLARPRYTPGSMEDPTGGLEKKEAAALHGQWLSTLSSRHAAVYTDGSESTDEDGKHVGYGFAVFRNGTERVTGSGALHDVTHVFDAEAIGALRGLEAALEDGDSDAVTVCVDSVSVIWGLRGDPSLTSQWAFRRFHQLVDSSEKVVSIRWCPGHEGIVGNERADALAKAGAMGPVRNEEEDRPTASGVRSQLRARIRAEQAQWWQSQPLSKRYRKWLLPYKVGRSEELDLPRRLLHRFLAMRHGHGDFAAYHKRFRHHDAELQCERCSAAKGPSHLIHCPATRARMRHWPKKVKEPRGPRQREEYMYKVLSQPGHFRRFVEVTECFEERTP